MSANANQMSRIKKSCFDCVAYESHNNMCELGHKTEITYLTLKGQLVGAKALKPIEPCDKPKSRKEFQESYKRRKMVV